MFPLYALYGLRGSGAASQNLLAKPMSDLGFHSCMANPDIWMWRATKPDGSYYYEHTFCSTLTMPLLYHWIRSQSYFRRLIHIDPDETQLNHSAWYLPWCQDLQGKAPQWDWSLGNKLKQLCTRSNQECWSMARPSWCSTPLLTSYFAPSLIFHQSLMLMTLIISSWWHQLFPICHWIAPMGRWTRLCENYNWSI